MKIRSHNETGTKGQRFQCSQDPHPWEMTPNGKIIITVRFSQGKRGLSPYWAPKPGSPEPRRQHPGTSGFESQRGLAPIETECCRKQNSLPKCSTQEFSFILSFSTGAVD